MKILLRDDMDIGKAHDGYLKFTRDERMKQIYEARLKRILDEASALDEAEQRGIKQGLEQGLEKSVVGFYEAGVSIPVIMKSTGLDEEKIRQILKKQGLL